jgi:choline dehydrogenase
MYDYIVVGAGSSGCVVACRLVERGCKVLLLEAGGKDDAVEIKIPAMGDVLMDTPYDWGYRTVAQRGLLGRKIFLPRGKCLGGSSSLNYMIYIRGTRADFASWQKLGADGWSYEDVLPYYIKSESNSRFNNKYHGTNGYLSVTDTKHHPLTEIFMKACESEDLPFCDDFNGENQEGYGYLQATIGKTGRCSTAVAFLRPIENKKNITILTHAHALKIIFEGKRAVGVEYMHAGRVETARCSNEIILSGGSINTPQLLMLSGVGPTQHLKDKGIQAVHDLPGVGQNLHDHTLIRCSAEIKSPLTVFGMSDEDFEQAKAQYLKDGTGPLATNWDEAGAFVKCDKNSEHPDIQLHFDPTFGSPQFEGGQPTDRHGYQVFSTICRPKSRGSLQLFSANPFDWPLIDPGYLTDESDVALAALGVQCAREILNSKAFASVGSKEIAPGPNGNNAEGMAEFVRRSCGTIFHPCSTTRMGKDDMSVVDPKLRVHGLEGLRIADASVMPTIITGNLNATCIMIGERAADFLAQSST